MGEESSVVILNLIAVELSMYQAGLNDAFSNLFIVIIITDRLIREFKKQYMKYKIC